MPIEPHRHGPDTAPAHHREGKIAGIEMLRAVAVLMVLVQHLPGMLPDLALLWLPGRLMANFNGGAGVDIFFCISGFVVGRSLLRDIDGLDRRDTLTVAVGFWIRRAFRLWPSAWLWLFAAYAVSLGFNRMGVTDPSADLRMIPAGIGMYANYLLMGASRAHQNLGVMSQYWSLSLEEQFYLALPLLLIVSRRAALPLLALYAGFRFFDYRDFWADIYLRPGCLVAGVALAYLERGSAWRRMQRVWQPGFASVVVCATLVLLAAAFDAIAPFERWFGVAMFRLAAPLETMACALIVLVAVQCTPCTPGMFGRVLVFLGSRSYAIYIVHQLAYAVTREIDGRLFSSANGFPLRLVTALAIATVLIAAATEFTVRCIEQPMRALGRSIADRVSERWPGLYVSGLSSPAWTSVDCSTVALPHGRRIADIEALRTIAIVFVMVEHATGNLVFQPKTLQSILAYGQLWPGVDLFFVISGFLVTSDLLRRFGNGDGVARRWPIILAFWSRRAWRLWPTAWLWLLLIVAGSAVVDPPFLGSLRTNLHGAAAGVFFYANYRMADRVAHFQPYGASYPYWSLSLEEQFYILLPILIWLFDRFLPAAICVAILLQLPLEHDTYYFFFRSDALLWGAALALWARASGYESCEPTFLKPRFVSAVFVLLALTSLFRWAGTGNIAPAFAIGGISAVSAVLVWAGSYDRNYICPPSARTIVLWAGSRSYAFYVAHIPIFQCSAALARSLFAPQSSIFSGDSDTYAVAIAVPSLMVCAELTHRVVERPLRRIGTRLVGHMEAHTPSPALQSRT